MQVLDSIGKYIMRYREILIYLLFGCLTTAVNYLIYFPCYNWLSLSATVSNVVAWAAAVDFAYLTNKPFVFKSYDWSWKVVMPELSKFVGCRIGSGLLETFAMWLFVDLLAWNGNWMKILVSILVVILNFVFSKWIVFTKKGEA